MWYTSVRCTATSSRLSGVSGVSGVSDVSDVRLPRLRHGDPDVRHGAVR